MNGSLYQSHLQKVGRDNEGVTMRLDGAEYCFEAKSGQWKMNILDKEYNALLHQNQKDREGLNQQKSEEQLLFEKKTEQLELLKKQVRDIKQKILDVEEQTKLSKECSDILTNTFVKEKLETERIREAREALEGVKQQLGQYA